MTARKVKGNDVFCSEEIRKGIFYKTKHTMAVCDIMPVMPGHSLIIPIRHVLDITELDDVELFDLIAAFKKVKPVILKLYSDKSQSYDFTAQVGRYSGMSVGHLHFHIIPRRGDDPYQDSEGKSAYDAIEKSRRLDPKAYKKRVEVLRKALKWSE